MRNKHGKLITFLTTGMLVASVLTGCQSNSSAAATDTTVAAVTTIDPGYSDRDLAGTWDTKAATKISLNGSSIAVSGSGAKVSGDTLTITAAGVYELSGTLTDGQIIVDAGDTDKVQIVLNGVTLTCSDSAPIYVKQADKVFLTLAAGSKNSVADGKAYNLAEGEDEPDAAIFSKDDLTINGTGALNVSANYNNGITSNDSLVITGGTISINAVNDGLRGRDSVAVCDGALVINATEGDGIQSNNDEETEKGWVSIDGGTFDITAGNDGVQAETAAQVTGGTVNISSSDDGIHAESTLLLEGGNINILQSNEGLEAAAITVNGGNIHVTALDDGLNATTGNPEDEKPGNSTSNAFIRITDGYLVVNADGDGIDSNGSLYVDGGTVLVNGPTNNGNGPLDYNGVAEITGGTVVVAGSSGMAQNFSDSSSQNSLLVAYSTVQKAGTLMSLQDESGKIVLSFAPTKDYQSIVISSPKLEQGKTYTLYSGGSADGKNTDGLYTDGSYSAGTKIVSVNLSKAATSIADTGEEFTGMGGHGGPGRPGGPGGDHGMGGPKERPMPADNQGNVGN